MKFLRNMKIASVGASLPAWGVWIEIALYKKCNGKSESLPAWGVWIEIHL